MTTKLYRISNPWDYHGIAAILVTEVSDGVFFTNGCND